MVLGDLIRKLKYFYIYEEEFLSVVDLMFCVHMVYLLFYNLVFKLENIFYLRLSKESRALLGQGNCSMVSGTI